MQPENNPLAPTENLLDANLQVNQESGEKLGSIDANIEASTVALNDIAANTEAAGVATYRLQEPLEKIVENTKPKDVQNVKLMEREDSDDESFNDNEAGKALWSMLRGPKGYTPKKGKDYFTEEETTKFKDIVTPKKGTDYFTEEEIKNFKLDVTPKKDVDYRDGIDGEDGVDGVDGRNPMTVSRFAPLAPKVGDIWYQP